ncbi:hypothetical protein D7X30_16675 [Corallococcus sp. AB011P]|uniref:hypothetical protein n=1 Tax=unclassified Corallococcus TaxID=2685029 RepID=UPI000EA231B8|nr:MULTISPECIES: hypothetical protein [unclassified Corallococcus]RKG58114.1 hypothetical protein D7X30_16675 [Corallococcus sp. AB011P]RKH80163.1 hypothetical protein D7Y21_32650 [Corallococcus sp. AB045]
MFTGDTHRHGATLVAALGIGMASLAGCGSDGESSTSPESAQPVELHHSESDLYASSAKLWRPMTIPV